MSQLTLCVDIDNVVAATDSVIRHLIRERTEGRVELEYSEIREFDYCLCPARTGGALTKAEWHDVHIAFSEPSNILKLSPFPGAQGQLRKLMERFRLHFATARLPKARQATIEWLEREGFPDHSLHFLRFGEKHLFLTNFSAVVEDDYDQARSFAEAGTPSFLLRHPWNAAKPVVANLQWAGDWSELSEKLLTTFPTTRGRPNSRVTRCHFDHSNANRVFMSRSNRPYGFTCSQISGVSAA